MAVRSTGRGWLATEPCSLGSLGGCPAVLAISLSHRVGVRGVGSVCRKVREAQRRNGGGLHGSGERGADEVRARLRSSSAA